MSEHTPEPWAVDGPRVYGANKVLVATVAYCRSNADVENASRIVACVNACIGSKTQDLKHYASLGGVEKIMSLLERDRDLLLATLKGVYIDAQAQDKLFEWWGPMKAAIAQADYHER